MSVQYEQSEREQRVDDVIAGYFELVEGGTNVSIEQWIQCHREFADDIREYFDDRQQIEQPAAPWRAISNTTAAIDFPGRLGDFRLIREVGRGGMGIVFEAQQISLNRRVALKVLPFAAVLDDRQLARFKNEAQAAAGLEHPHIVNVLFVGHERGVHFYAMRYVDGLSLAEVIDELREPRAL